MKGPHLERTASLITVPPASGKYAIFRPSTTDELPFSLFPCGRVRRSGSPASSLLLLSVHSPAYEGETERRFNVLLLFSVEYFFPEGKWAALGGSAIPRQPVAGTREASFPQPSSKNQFN